MMNLGEVLALIRAMNREGVGYITFGAVALSVHGLARNTEDADFFVEPTLENIERLKRALHSVWDDPSIDEIDGSELVSDYPAVRYGPPNTDLYMDFLTRLGEAYSYETLDWETKDVQGVPVRVVTPKQLYLMKRDTVRPKDKHDAEWLRQEFDLSED